MSDLGALLPLLLLVLVFYFFIIRPQSKRRREFMDMQTRVSLGARIMLTSGIYGTIVGLGDDTMTVSIAPGVEVEVHRNVVAKILDDTEGASADDNATDTRWTDDEDGKA